MGLLAAALPLFPLLAAGVVGLAGWRPSTAWAGVAAAGATIGAGIALAAEVIDHGAVDALGGLVRVDALSAFMAIVIGVIALIATTYGVAYVRAELDEGHVTAAGARSYGTLVQLFVAAMLAAVVADNLGVMWVAVEGTTITTAFLVGHRRTRASLEASWKYVVIASVGVALAFLGTVLVYFASRHAGGDVQAGLNWTTLVRAAPRLDPGVVRLALGLLVLGYGTKVGLAPVHTWLPDAHSQAPAPVSALMSGVQLPVAFYAILRYKVVADIALGPGYLRGLLLVGALLSLAVAASLLLAQRDYKRLLAYHSIEHMGLLALGTAIGSRLAVAAVLLHVLGHGVVKAVMFCSSGEILFMYGTTEIACVRGLLARRPLVGASFGIGLLALLGLPPFSLFASELAMFRAGIGEGMGWAVAATLVLAFVVFVAAVDHGRHMLLGEAGPDVERHRTSAPAAVALVGGLLVVAALGVSTWPIDHLLRTTASVVTG